MVHSTVFYGLVMLPGKYMVVLYFVLSHSTTYSVNFTLSSYSLSVACYCYMYLAPGLGRRSVYSYGKDRRFGSSYGVFRKSPRCDPELARGRYGVVAGFE